MQSTHNDQRKLYVGMHDGVCALSSTDAGKTWQQGQVTPLAHAAARLSTSATAPQRAYLAAYEAGVYRTDDGGLTWRHLASYPSDYAHSVLVHPQDAQTVYVGSEPATVFCSRDGGGAGKNVLAFGLYQRRSSGFPRRDPAFARTRPAPGSTRSALPVCRN